MITLFFKSCQMRKRGGSKGEKGREESERLMEESDWEATSKKER